MKSEMDSIAKLLSEVEPKIRYVAVNQNGVIREMQQFHATFNPSDTDRMEELVVNPVILEAASRRGNLDLDGVRYVLICYGLQYQVIIPYREGHVSIGINLSDDPIAIAEKITGYLALQPADSAV
jgi:hypothetical protein